MLAFQSLSTEVVRDRDIYSEKQCCCWVDISVFMYKGEIQPFI